MKIPPTRSSGFTFQNIVWPPGNGLNYVLVNYTHIAEMD